VKTLLAAFVTAATLTALPAQAADIRVEHARNAGVPLITLTGDILPGDGNEFWRIYDLAKAEVSTNQPLLVVLNSNGGDMAASLSIGRLVRHFGMVTVAGSMCASGCAIVWIAGKERLALAGSQIGFHSSAKITDPDHPSASGNALVGAYLAELDLSDRAIMWLTDAPPTGMNWLDSSTAAALGIEMHVLNGEIAPPAPAPSQPRQSYGTQNWQAYGKWIQLASRNTYELAVADAQKYGGLKDVFVFVSTSKCHCYAIAVGPFPANIVQAAFNDLMGRGKLSDDAQIKTGESYGELVWRKLRYASIPAF
jgi:hypothetical protein